MTRIKLFPKTFILTTVLFVVLGVIIHSCIFFLVPKIYRDIKDKDTTKQISELVHKVNGKDMAEVLKRSEEYSRLKNVNVNIIVGRKEHFFERFKPQNVMSPSQIKGDLTIVVDDKYVDMSSIILKVREAKDAEGRVFIVQLMTDVRPISEARAATLKTLPYSIVISLICALIFSYVYSRLTTKPIKNMVEVTGKMQKLDKNAHYAVNGEDEINVLGSHINELYSDLCHMIDSLEKENFKISKLEKDRLIFMRAASHELKTPLTSLRVMLENMALNIGEYKNHEKYLEESIIVVDKMYEMIRDIMASHDEIQGGIYSENSIIKVDDVLLSVLDEYRILAESKGIEISINTQHIKISNNRSLLEKVFSNIISNAIHYTEKEGKVEIDLTDRYISVKNECKPIESDKLNKIFEPLYRLDESRNYEIAGSGMGLYIIKVLLESKGMKYSFLPCDGGMEFKIEMDGEEQK